MKAEIESIVCNWADEIPHILIRVINAITLSVNEEWKSHSTLTPLGK